MRMSYIGRPVPRVDAQDKVTGRALYPADYYFPDMLHLKVLRAPHPHALIRRIDTSRAASLPGVEKILTAEDLPAMGRYGLIIKDQEALVREKTRFMGDALAVVAARTREEARKAIRFIEVEYEELPVMTCPRQAMEKGAVAIHPEGNVVCTHGLDKGDVERGFKQADRIMDGSYSTPHLEHVALQPESGVAIYDPAEDLITIWAATQWLHDTQLDVAGALGLSPARIKMIQPTIGGAFGKREDISVQIHLALMARLTGQPVKLEYTREESIISQAKRHPISFNFRTGVKEDGTITAWEAEVIGDTGAYAAAGPAVVRQALYHCTGPYNVANVRGRSWTVYTNNTFCGAMRGFGATQAAFAYESHMDYMARELGMDSVEFRLKNAYDAGSTTPNGQILKHSVGVKETIRKAARTFGWQEYKKKSEGGKKRGRGMATIMFGCGYGEGFPDHSWVELEVTSAGRVLVRTAAADVGQGVLTVISQIVAEVLNIPLQLLEIAPAATDRTRSAGSTSASRQTIFSGNAALLASEELKGKIYHEVVMVTGQPYPAVEIVGGEVKVGQDRITLGELSDRARARGNPLQAQGCFFPTTDEIDENTGQTREVAYLSYTFNTQMVEVEVDTETGQVEVLQVVAAPDVGRTINTQGVEGQSEGGIAMGWGMALTEVQIIKDGMTLNPDLSTYIIPTALDVPPMETVIVESGDARGPFGAKGIGEPALIATAPAIINAIYDAVGVRIKDLPATPGKILNALAEKKGEEFHE